jgi:major membrane immunogen (membrane-anchored lipoprotein)
MKKNMIGALVILSLLLVSCGKKEVENTDVKVSDITTKTVTEEQKVENSGDTVEKLNTTMLEIFKS